MRWRSASFSPLFIGEYSSTAPSPITNLCISSLSVPSSSGNTLQRIRSPPWKSACSTFSPLFIGEYSSTAVMSSRAMCVTSFQSPLHRGILFNLTDNFLREVWNQLSVPSSSGNTLQPHAQAHNRKGDHTFSPLFIGEYSSTAVAWGDPTDVIPFQSPLHRGILFNRIRR